MAHTISEWLLPLFAWAQFSQKPATQRNARLEKLRAERTGKNSRKSIHPPLSPEEEIIIQMGAPDTVSHIRECSYLSFSATTLFLCTGYEPNDQSAHNLATHVVPSWD
jgi:hypothetical protein